MLSTLEPVKCATRLRPEARAQKLARELKLPAVAVLKIACKYLGRRAERSNLKGPPADRDFPSVASWARMPRRLENQGWLLTRAPSALRITWVSLLAAMLTVYFDSVLTCTVATRVGALRSATYTVMHFAITKPHSSRNAWRLKVAFTGMARALKPIACGI